MSSSASQIEREVEASRANVEETVEALKDKMSIGQMVDEAARYFGNKGGSDMMANLGAQVRDNPLPIVLIGAGLAWLMSGRGTPHIGGRRSSGSRYDDLDYGYDDENAGYGRGGDASGYAGSSRGVYSGASHPDYAGRSYGSEGGWSGSEDSSGPSYTERAGEMLEGAGHTARRAMHGAGDAAGGVMDAAGNLVSGIASAAGTVASAASRIGRGAYSAAGTMASGARTGAGAAWRGGSSAYRGATRVGAGAYRGASWAGSSAYEGASWAGSSAYEGASQLGYRARRSFSDVLESEPLVLGAIGLAVGAAAGAILPRTEYEDRYMGETRDRLREDAEAYAREKYEQGKTVATEAYRTVKEEAEARGLTSFGDDSIVDRVGQVARATLDRARESAQEQGLTGGTSAGSDDTGGESGNRTI